MEKETNHQFRTFFLHRRMVLAVKRVELVHGSMSYIVLWSQWHKIIVFNVHEPSEEKSDTSKDSYYEEFKQVFNHFPKYHTKILLGDFNAKLGREDNFKPTSGNDNLHHESNGNSVKIVYFAILKNLVVKSTMFLHQNIHKYSWTSPDWKTHNQIDHILYQIILIF
jgi:exonuclease III